MKKVWLFLVSLFAFLATGNSTTVGIYEDDDLDTILNGMGKSFAKMNFDGSFDSKNEQANFNLRVKQVLQAPAIQAIVNGTGVPNASGGGMGVAQSFIANSVGDLNLVVKRVSANIAGVALPYAVFGTNDLDAEYMSTLKGLLPSGVTLVSVTKSAGKIIFTYNKAVGDLTDTIEVRFNGLNNYVSFLQSLNSNFFKTQFTLYSISDVTQLSQFFEPILFGLISSLGGTNGNQLNPNSRKLANQQQSDRVELIMPEQHVGSDFTFVQNIIAVAGFEINWDIYMSSGLSLNKKA